MAPEVQGVIGSEGSDAGPVPTASVAVTRKEYARPARRPVMMTYGWPLVAGVIRPVQGRQAGSGMTR